MTLKELLNLTDEQFKKSRIGLNMLWDGKSHFSRWYESDADNRDVSYNYAPYYANKANYKIGDLSFGFVRLPNDNDLWLFVTAGQITSIPERSEDKKCEYNVIERYKPLFGKVIIRYHKGNTHDRYIFTKKSIFDDAIVETILKDEYELKNPKIVDRKVILQPYGDAENENHFTNSINKPRKLAEFLPYCSKEEIEFLKKTYPSNDINVWGILPGDKNEPSWQSMNVGDIVLFNKDKTFFASCEVTYKTHNKDLAKALFGTVYSGNKKGETYEFVYFFNNICFFEIPNSEFNRFVGYKEKNNVQGFQVLNEEKSYKILSTFDVSAMIEKPNDEDAKNKETEITSIELIDSIIIKNREVKESDKKNYDYKPDFNQINRSKSASGLRAENLVLEYEKKNNPIYADKIIRVGDFPAYGYDIKSYDANGNEKHIEVKTCKSGSSEKIDFFLTKDEKKQMETDATYCIYYVCGKSKKQIFVLNKENIDSITLVPTVYKVSAKAVEDK